MIDMKWMLECRLLLGKLTFRVLVCCCILVYLFYFVLLLLFPLLVVFNDCLVSNLKLIRLVNLLFSKYCFSVTSTSLFVMLCVACAL